MIVRWGLLELEPLLAELGVERALLTTSERWRGLVLPVAGAFYAVRRHVPAESVEIAAARAADFDGLVALGGGSAIDTAKAVSAATGLPVVAVPTTYSGAEWTSGFGVRDETARRKGGGVGAPPVAVVYEPDLTFGLPRDETVGTAMNALAHCAEALYVAGRNDDADEDAVEGAALIGRALPRAVVDGGDATARRELLEGAMHAGRALAGAGLGLAHAMAQALGGRFGLPHGALNAICLPPALRFNADVAWDALERLAHALETDDAVDRAEELAGLGGFGRLRDLGVPADELDDVAEDAARRPGGRANPRPADPHEVAELLRTVW